MGNGPSFIARRSNGHDAWPVFQTSRFEIIFAHAPKMSARQEKINPDRQRDRGEKNRRKRHALFCNKPVAKRYARSSARMGNRRIGLPVAAEIALHTAGAIGGVPGSPTPPGGSLLGTM